MDGLPNHSTKEHPMRHRTLSILLALSFVALTACGPSAQQIQATVEAGIVATNTASTAMAAADTCSDARLLAYADAVEQLLDCYETQTEVVGATPRVGLGTPLQRLLDYEDEAARWTPQTV